MMLRSLAVSTVFVLSIGLAGCGNPSPEESLANADDLFSRGELRSAMIELKNALQEDPSFAPARARLGTVQASLGDHASALKEYERALDLGLDNDDVRIGILRSKNYLGRYSEVIGELEDAAKLDDTRAALLGTALLASGDEDRAEIYLQQAKDIAAGAIGLAQLEARRDQPETALELAAKASELPDATPEILLTQGEIQLTFGRWDEALETFRKAGSVASTQLPARLGIARAFLGKGDLASAAAEAAAIVAASPRYPPANFLSATIALQQDDLEAAERFLIEVQSVAPDHTPSMYMMGVIKQRQGKLSQAEDQVRRFLAREPNSAEGLKLLGAMLGDQGKLEEVVELLRTSDAVSSDAQLLAMLGTAQLRLNRTAEATANLQRAVELAPDMGAFQNQLALSLVAGGDSDAAESVLRGALQIDDQQYESEYLLAMLKIQQKDRAGAEEVVNGLLAQNGEIPLPYHLRGLAKLLDEDVAGATADFQLALQKDGGYVPAAQSLAQLAIGSGDVKEARRIMAELLVAIPDDEGALLANADLALSDKATGDAIAYLERAAEKNPKGIRSRIILSRLYFMDERVDDALRLVNEGLALAPGQTDLLLMQADIGVSRGDREMTASAAEELQRQLSSAPKNARLTGAVGAIQLRLGEVAAARRNLEKALELTEGKNQAALLSLSRLHLEQGDAKKARERFDALVATGARGGEIDLVAADVLFLEGKTDQAISAYDAMISRGVREALFRRSAILQRDGDREAAAALFEDWLKERPEDPIVKFRLADLYMALNYQSKALPLYEALVDLNSAAVFNNLAWLYQEAGDKRSIDVGRKALELAPDSAEVLDTVGWILVQNEQLDEGLRHLRRSAELNPDNGWTFYHLGIALSKTGSRTEARTALERSIEIGNFPDLEKAKTALADLDS
jgi:putative PEP-CTERM system TPR-repeat lipoprotein